VGNARTGGAGSGACGGVGFEHRIAVANWPDHKPVQWSACAVAVLEAVERMAEQADVRTLSIGSDDEVDATSLNQIDLYSALPECLNHVESSEDPPHGFYTRQGFKVAGVLPDANGPGRPDIFFARRVGV